MPAISVQNITPPFGTITAGSADVVFTAGDVGGDTIACTGREIIIAFNSGASAYTITVSSVADEKGRTGDISAYSLAAGDYVALGVGLTNSQGWKNSSGNIAVSVSNAAIKWMVLRLPAGFPA